MFSREPIEFINNYLVCLKSLFILAYSYNISSFSDKIFLYKGFLCHQHAIDKLFNVIALIILVGFI